MDCISASIVVYLFVFLIIQRKGAEQRGEGAGSPVDLDAGVRKVWSSDLRNLTPHIL